MVEFANPSTSSSSTSIPAHTYSNNNTYTYYTSDDGHHSHPFLDREYDQTSDTYLSDDEEPPIPPQKDITHIGISQQSGASRHSPDSIDYDTLQELAEMDVRELLAQCEDPTIGWASQFWVTIADPITDQVFFACPATGMTTWDPPIGAFLLPRQTEGEWWELGDVTRGNTSYYYNTLTGNTQWTRPSGNAFVIPLGLLQKPGIPPRPASATTLEPRTETPAHLSPNKRTHLAPPVSPDAAPIRAGPPPPPSPRRATGSSPSRVDPSHIKYSTNWHTKELATLDEVSSQGTGDDMQMRSIPSRRAGSGTSMERDNDSSLSKSPTTPPTTVVGPSLFSKASPKEPIRVDTIRTKRLSTGLHPLLPPSISSQIKGLKTIDSTQKYFATRRSGFTRQKVPIDRIMEWQRSSISAPILVISHPAKDAVTTFKIIQHVMGERERVVDIPRPTRSGRDSPDKILILEEIRWMIQLAVTSKDMRDEVYCQLIKQLTRNVNPESMILGFQLFCVLVNSFSPGSKFEPIVRSFLSHSAVQIDNPVGIMSKYCIAKLEVMITQGSRGKTLTIGEIETASDAAFYPSVYGESLERIMNLQQRSYPSSPVPVILPFLTDGILALGGTESEGIFRIPGDNEAVSELKSRMDRGHYQLSGIDDPHVAASLFKLWLRELESPIIPTKLYNTCLAASISIDESIEFVKQLPILNRRVLLFVISFIKLFLLDDVVAVTKMTASNLALVMAPNLLRTTSDSLATVFTNSAFESKFVLNLLQHMDPRTIDPGYIPRHGMVSLSNTPTST